MKNNETVRTTLRIPKDLYTLIQQRAIDEKRSLNSQILHILDGVISQQVAAQMRGPK